MHQYKVALLEDNKKQLEKLESYLTKIPNVEFVLVSTSSDDFFEQLKNKHIEILLADLDLGNDSMTGMEVAQELKIPVFFASINTADYVENMEHLKRDAEICIDHITKPFTEEQFIKSFKRFLREVDFFSNSQYVYLDFNKTKRNKILIDDIVYLCADKELGSIFNNKQIYFTNRTSLNDKLELTALSQYRSFDLGGDGRLFLINAYLDYEIMSGLEIGGGGMFLVLNSYNSKNEKKSRYEVRPFQQITLKSKLGKILISHRYRIEERFLNHPEELKVRLRYLLSMKIPIGKAGQYYGILKNEIRINVDKSDIFDSDRITAGLGRKLGKSSAAELTFLNQMGDHRTDNYITIGFRNNFDWKK